MAKKRSKKTSAAGFQNRIRELRQVPAAELQRNPKNWRLHPERQQNALKSVLDRIGYVDALIAREDADGTLVLIDGHLRADVSSDQNVPVLIVDVTEEEADAILASFDSVTAMAEVDEAKLQELLWSIEVEGLDDLISDVGTLYDLALEGDEASDQADVDPDEVPPAPKKAITKPGDLWILGNHRLLCGDSTKAADVERLMDGKQAAFCLTDPPYSVNYDKSHEVRGGKDDVHSSYNEADSDPTSLLAFMEHVNANVMIWSYPIDRHFQKLAAAYKKHNWEFKKELVWVKDSFSFWMSAKYQQKHESLMLAVRKGKTIGGQVPANATTVLEYPRPKSHDLHPTAKPIDMWSLLVEYHTSEGELIYEPFCGSGTTLIAAEQLQRRCYGMELSPNYCDVIVARWEQITGGKAKRSRTK